MCKEKKKKKSFSVCECLARRGTFEKKISILRVEKKDTCTAFRCIYPT